MNNFILTDKQRKKSNIKGTGIQYLPGHRDGFVDFCVNKVKKNNNKNLRVLEIGGGGLRFASSILELKNIQKIYIVDLDYYSLDYKRIFTETSISQKYYKVFERKCILIVSDILTFLDMLSNKIQFDYISAFRTFHFFSLYKFEKIAEKISNFLRIGGTLFISGISSQDNQCAGKRNYLYLNSSPITGNKNHRKFDVKKSDVYREIKRQNLPEKMLFFDCSFLDNIFNQYGLKREGKKYPSTRIVNGYIYRRLR